MSTQIPAAQSIQSPCQDALKRFAQQHFEQWTGLPTNCSLVEVLAQFKRLNNGVGYGTLGTEPAQFLMVVVPNYPEPVRVWYRSEQVVLLDVAYPDFLKGKVAALGEPAARLDYYWKRLLIPGGLWVFPSKGLALYVNSANGALIHLTVFSPTTLEQYQQALMLSLRTERLPYDNPAVD